jgi:hypothetical protein
MAREAVVITVATRDRVTLKAVVARAEVQVRVRAIAEAARVIANVVRVMAAVRVARVRAARAMVAVVRAMVRAARVMVAVVRATVRAARVIVAVVRATVRAARIMVADRAWVKVRAMVVDKVDRARAMDLARARVSHR